MTRGARVALLSGIVVLLAAGVAEVWTPATSSPSRSPPYAASAPSPPPPRHHQVTAMGSARPGMGLPYGVSPPEHGAMLPPGTEHGLAHRLSQYPAVFLATARQRAAAERLRRQLLAAAQRWATPQAAAAAGFDLRRARRSPGERRVMWFHAENRRWPAVRDAVIDASRPHTLIYADLPGRPLRLVGVMISMPRGVRGPTPGGPITRWHHHLVCVVGNRRGHAPRDDGSCPPGTTLAVGSEMMHVWFTRDLRSAFAIHAPWPELCVGHLLPAATCAAGKRFLGM
jgi:hypothetical protein